MQALNDFLSINNLMPHGYCLSWNPTLLWLHVISDVLITLSYYSIPLSLAYFIRKRKDFPYAWLVTMGALFIVACGTTHLMSAVLIWIPLYWVDGFLKAFTAAISLITAVAMWKIIPLALKLPTTAQLLAEQEKTISEKYKLSAILDNAPVAAYTKDTNYRYQYSNRLVSEIFNLPSTQIIGCQDSDFFDDETVQEIRRYDQKVLENGERIETIHSYHLKNGEERIFLTTKEPLRDKNGNIYALSGISTDVTELKRSEVAQQEALSRLNKIANQLPSLVFQFRMRPDGSVCLPYASEVLRKIYRIDPASVREDATAVFAVVHPDDLDNHLETIKKSARELSPWRDEYRLKFADGTECWLWGNALPELEEDGSVLWHGFVSDITERKRIELDILNTRNQLQATMNAIPDVLFELDLDGRFHDYYAHRNEKFSLKAGQLLGKKISTFLPSDAMTICLSALQEAKKQGWSTGKQIELELAGEMNWFELSIAIKPTEDENSPHFVVLSRNITERKKMELELQRSNAELEQFAYAVSHDMRQPLRMVTSYLSLIEKALTNQLDEETQQFMDFAIEGSKRMDGMILSLLDYSRVGRLTTPLALISSQECVNEAVLFLQPELKNGTVSISGDWIELLANRDELTRLLQNLIGNALKYHDENKPSKTEVLATATEKWFRVEVRDNGIGIAANQIDRLFKVFSRLQARSRFEGTGIGLALCRKIVEHHGGKIGVISEGEGFGSTFWFELPLVQHTVSEQ
ncbi:MAG: PAS domain-containing protein [Methylococcales bacterium]|nr:PAS domain-containing protein [Methylococcales bacterium]